MQWQTFPPGGAHSLALFSFLLESFPRLSQGRNHDLGFSIHVLTSCVVMFWVLLSFVQFRFILFHWDLGKGHCKGMAILT